SSRSCGRARLPQWVVRIRSVLRFMAVCSSLAAGGQLRKLGDGPRRTGQLQDVHAGVGAIDNIDIPAVIDLDVIGLNGHLAGVPTAGGRYTALVGLLRNRRNVKGRFLRTVRITDIHSPYAGVEVGDEHEAPI